MEGEWKWDKIVGFVLDKSANDGIYVEMVETGSMVKDPQMVKLTAGEKFPDNTNHNRQWTYKKKTVIEAAIIIAAFHIIISFTALFFSRIMHAPFLFQ